MNKSLGAFVLVALTLFVTTLTPSQIANAVAGDTSGPIVLSSSMSKSTVEVGTTSDTFDLTLHITDESGFGSGSMSCILPGGSTEIYSNLGYSPVDGWYSLGPQGSSLKSASGNQQDAVITIEVQANYGIYPGTLDCYLWSYDSPFGNQGFSRLGQITVTRTGTGYDDLPPVLESYSYSKTKAEIGSSNDKITVSFRVTDQTGFDRGQFTCLNSVTNSLVSFTQIYAPLQTAYESSTRLNWSANDLNGNYWTPEVTGTNQDATLSLGINISFGISPGTIKCSLLASDRLEHIGNSPVGTFRIYNTPPGQPSQPLNFNASKVATTDATLNWDSPSSLGTPTLSGYELQSSTDGTSWTDALSGVTDKNSVIVSNLLPDTDYWFRVRGDNGGVYDTDTSDMDLNWASVKLHTNPPSKPNQPTDLLTTGVESTGFSLDWTAPANNVGSGTTDYSVEASVDNGTTWVSLKNSASTATHLAFTGASPGTSYLLRIAAVNSLGTSEYLTGSVTTSSVQPDAPQNLRYLNLTGTSLSLEWDSPKSNGGSSIKDYVVEYSSNGGTAWISIPHTPSTYQQFSVTNLSKNSTYNFRVSATNEVGTSAPSNILSATTPITLPGIPTSPVFSKITSSSVVISWQAPLDDGGASISDYKVELSNDAGTTWTEITHSPSTTTSTSVNGLKPGVQYLVRISAKNAFGYGTSLPGTFRSLNGVPQNPTMLLPNIVTATSVTLNWTLPFNGGSSITDYKVEISSNCSTYSTLKRSASTAQTYNVTGLSAGTKYCFRVSAVNVLGAGPTSNPISQVTVGNAPSAPTGLSAKYIKSSGFTLVWSAAKVTSGSAVRDYVVEYSKDNGATWTVFTKQVSTSTSLEISGLKTKTTYLYRVKAINDVGTSLPSANLKILTT